MARSRKRVLGLTMVLLVCTILSCVLYYGWPKSIMREDVIGVYILDSPFSAHPRTYGIHTLTLKENGIYEYRWRGTQAESDTIHTDTWTFQHFAGGAHIRLDQFQLEPYRDYLGPHPEDQPYHYIFPVVRLRKGTLQLSVTDLEECNFNKQ